MNPLTKVYSPTLHLTILATVLAFVVLVFASFVIEIEIVAQGMGKVVPTGHVQVIQTEFGGQIIDIPVAAGQTVKKGQLLLALDQTEATAQLNALEQDIIRQEITHQRITSLLSNLENNKLRKTNFNQNVAFNQPSIVYNFKAIPLDTRANVSRYLINQEKLLVSELAEIASTIKNFDSRIESNAQSQQVTLANIERIDAQYQIQQERYRAAEQLAESGTISRSDFLTIIETSTGLEKQRNVYRGELSQKISISESLIAEKGKYFSGIYADYFQKISAIDARVASLKEDLLVKQRALTGMNLRSPVDGVIDNLIVHTVGGIIGPGSVTMHVVPIQNKPVVEVLVSNQDIGFLQTGQQANIKLSAYPSERFGYLEGKVTNIAADAVEISKNNWGFSVKIEPSKSYLSTPSDNHEVRSGMTATVDIITGKRTLISYFFAPILKTVQDSLGER